MRRPKLIYSSQVELVDAWVRLAKPHDVGTCPTHGMARGWWRSRTTSFEGIHYYSLECLPNVEIARLMQTPRGKWVVAVRKDVDGESLARKARVSTVRWRTVQAKLEWVNVEQFEDIGANQAWYAARVQQKYGKWQRARQSYTKSWRMQQLEEVCAQRARFERLFGLKKTKEESEVRCARVVQRLVGNS